MDGVDLSTVRLESYRTQLGVVLQDTFLFDGTIRENVAFSRPEAQRRRRSGRVPHRPRGRIRGIVCGRYDTVVGERGVKLSGGQRQRISIARAILADPRILILDEATSSLDSESEALIQEGLSYLMRGRTTFVIAHRLSTIRRADQILVMEAGRIIERGTHESLYAWAAAISTSTPSSTACRRICFSRRARAIRCRRTRGKTKRREVEMAPSDPLTTAETTNRTWRARRDFSAGRRELLAAGARTRG